MKEELVFLEGIVAFAGSVDELAGAPVLRRIQILPRGICKIRDGRKMKVEQSDIDAVMKAANDQINEIATLVQHGEDIKYGTEAVGWIKRLEEDAKGVWAYVEWSAEIAAAIRAKKFKYISPGVKFTRDAEGYMRPVYVQEASLTNTPAIDGMDLLAASEKTIQAKESTHMASKPVQPDPEVPGEKLDPEDTVENCTDCKQPFKGKHTNMCERKGKGMSESKVKEYPMDDKTITALKEKQDALEAQFTAFTESATKTFAKMAEDIEAKILPGVTAAAEKHADAKLAEQRQEDAFTAVLDGATTEGRLTAAQRECFMVLVAGNHNPESAAKFVATLPVTAPVKELDKNVPDPNLETAKTETRAEFLDRVIKFADRNAGMSIVTAETILTAQLADKK